MLTTNLEMAWILEEIADLLELKGEAAYKVRAYRLGARAVKSWPQQVAELVSPKDVQQIPGIGKNLAAKLLEIAATGSSSAHQRLLQEVPVGLREMLSIPGMGPSSVRLVYQQLNLTSLDELEAAAKQRRIREVPGMGSKTELNILQGIDMLRRQREKIQLGLALPLANAWKNQLGLLPAVTLVEVCGEVRRSLDMVSRVELVVGCANSAIIEEIFASHPQVIDWTADQGRLEFRTRMGALVVIHPGPCEDFYERWHRLTGSAQHLARLERLPVESSGLPADEEAIYRTRGLAWIPPELREDGSEVDRAIQGNLPNLVRIGDIQGDLHIHTNYSDGVDGLETVVAAARQRGYAYLAITEHSQSLTVARGLNPAKLREQYQQIQRLNEQVAPFRVFTGAEVDILADGSLDYADDLLRDAEVVIASVHSHFKQSKAEMTARVVKALRHPLVRILAHPTGRMLGRREGYAIDLAEVFKVAAAEGKALEINASPDRLDLEASNVRQAMEMGIPIAINTDAHEAGRLVDMEYGVLTARRGWCEPQVVLNTWDVAALISWLSRCV